MARALILANGDPVNAAVLNREVACADMFYVTDGAANSLLQPVRLPEAILGDMDSIALSDSHPLFHVPRVVLQDQDASDLEKAIEFVIAQGAIEITILGVVGDRLDHVFVSVALLLKFAGRTKLKIVHEQAEVRVVTDHLDLAGEPGDTVSLICFETVTGISTVGLAYPLLNETLSPGSRGVSNVMIAPEADIKVQTGALLVVHSRVRK